MNSKMKANIEQENKLLDYIRDKLGYIDGLEIYNIAEPNVFRYNSTGFDILDAVVALKGDILFYIELKERKHLKSLLNYDGLYIQAKKLEKLKANYKNTFVIYFDMKNRDINYYFLVNDILGKTYTYNDADINGRETYSVTDIQDNTIERLKEYIISLGI